MEHSTPPVESVDELLRLEREVERLEVLVATHHSPMNQMLLEATKGCRSATQRSLSIRGWVLDPSAPNRVRRLPSTVRAPSRERGEGRRSVLAVHDAHTRSTVALEPAGAATATPDEPEPTTGTHQRAVPQRPSMATVYHYRSGRAEETG